MSDSTLSNSKRGTGIRQVWLIQPRVGRNSHDSPQRLHVALLLHFAGHCKSLRHVVHGKPGTVFGRLGRAPCTWTCGPCCAFVHLSRCISFAVGVPCLSTPKAAGVSVLSKTVRIENSWTSKGHTGEHSCTRLFRGARQDERPPSIAKDGQQPGRGCRPTFFGQLAMTMVSPKVMGALNQATELTFLTVWSSEIFWFTDS